MLTTKTSQPESILGKPNTRFQLSLIVPSTQNYNVLGNKIVRQADEIIRQAVIDELIQRLSIAFGGTTTEVILGSWYDSYNDNVVKESGTRISVLTAKPDIDQIRLIQELSHMVKTVFNQDSVLITIQLVNGWFI